MNYDMQTILDRVVSDVESELLKQEHIHTVNYPQSMGGDWDVSAITNLNKGLLDKTSKQVNLYAFFVTPQGSDQENLVYVGKSTRKLGRQRIRNHLITKHAKTGSKLDNIKQEVNKGSKIRVSFLAVEPESMRNAIEEELIKKLRPNWNVVGC